MCNNYRLIINLFKSNLLVFVVILQLVKNFISMIYCYTMILLPIFVLLCLPKVTDPHCRLLGGEICMRRPYVLLKIFDLL